MNEETSILIISGVFTVVVITVSERRTRFESCDSHGSMCNLKSYEVRREFTQSKRNKPGYSLWLVSSTRMFHVRLFGAQRQSP